LSKKEKVKKPFYKKWWVWVIAIIIVYAIFGGGEETKEEVKEEDSAKTVDQEAFRAYAQNIMGRTFIKSISVTENKGLIEFYGSYDEFKQAKPDSPLTEEEYKGYFETGDAIEKIFVGENVRLLRQFPDLDSTSMVLPYGGKTYSTDLNRKEVNDYLGFKVEELSVEERTWHEKFSNPILGDDGKRKEFFDTFVEVK
jgi:hypothetical protein